MNAQAEVSGLLQELVGPIPPSAGAVKAAIWRAVALTGFSYARARGFWYGTARAWSDEMDLLRDKVNRARALRELEVGAKNHETRKLAGDVAAELAEIKKQLEFLNQRMARAEIDRSGEVAGGRKHGSDAQGEGNSAVDFRGTGRSN